MDMAYESGGILRLCQTASQKFRAADNALQGRFQFMGYIGRELPAEPFPIEPLRNIKGQNNSTDDGSVGFDTAARAF